MRNNILTLEEAGAILYGMPSKDTQIASAPYPKALLKKIDEYAKYKGVSRSDVLRWAAVDFLHDKMFGGRDE